MQRTAGVASQRQELNRTWSKWRLPLILLIVLVALTVAGDYAYRLYLDTQAQQKREATMQAGQTYAARLGRAIVSVWPDIEGLLPERDLARLVSQGDAAAISAREREIARRSPAILRVWLLRPGADAVDYSTDPPLSYASLDLLRRSAESPEPLPPEVHLFGREGAHIAEVRPLMGDDGALVGQALLAIDPSLPQRAMGEVALALVADYTELRQIVPGSGPLTLASRGDESLGSAPPDFVGNVVPGTRWPVAFWLQPEEPAAVFPREAMIGAVAGVTVVLLLLVTWAVRRRYPAVPAPRAARTPVEERPAPEERSGEATESGLPRSPPPAWSDEATAGIVVEEVEDVGETGREARREQGQTPPRSRSSESVSVPASIFRAYDIRGVMGKTLGSQTAREIGRAIGSEAHDRGQQTMVIGRDGRKSSPELAEALIEGLRAAGRDVIDIGCVPTPVLYFATHYLNTGSGVMVTGSHNPPEHNGFKIMLAEETLFGDDIAALRSRLESGTLADGHGNLQAMDVAPEYVRTVSEDVPVALGNAYKVVVDCGNGAASELAPKLVRALGHDVVPLYCEIDGRFPNHHPDPSQPENLRALIAAVREQEADLGFAFDGDGDRLGVVDGKGQIIWPDRQMMLFARDVLSRNRGAKVVYDVKCTNLLAKVIEKLGGEPIMSRTGHSFIKSKMRETGALLAGEMSGHIFFKERWYGFDDALYAAARMLEILLALKKPPTEVFARLPCNVATPELRVDMQEGAHLKLMQRLAAANPFAEGRVTTVDGLRVDYPDRWGLVRASNTTPCLVLRFEATDEKGLRRIQEEFRRVLLEHHPDLALPF
ncbi:MAG: phosphomannomutase/phosphoglucomutase [Gammaproteobacteria bacterium]|nr:phosphomannomutase/phosphoglucomutase [Gammaproteobacteria bacterium]NIR82726.1 phosphomannomutase/phosphoglucomutase [Gammaproteobacteria bacterium]NIR89590.1 phosphomannomutase/phosphoglucomutase [Gammaproteobacteria bacterium]NIU03886.1 phosphomannomutase/phosphoglucomutase [Gammaproteobacteria bacterium]NIV51202.1 phosphomannomutase/phosphoglucomutase [Gammaproteobacteria bacterium]